MTSFHQLSQLMILIFFIANQFNLVVSNTLTLQSSNSHLNLNRIIYTPAFRRTELSVSFNYRPLNKRFVLISGILDLQSTSTEISDLLKFTLVIDHLDRPELIIDKRSKSRDGLLANYFRLERNQTKFVRLGEPFSLMKSTGRIDEHRSDSADKITKLNDDLINKSSKAHLIERNQPHRSNASKIEHMQAGSTEHPKNKTTNNAHSNYETNNWRLLTVTISGDQFRMTHMRYASCSFKAQWNCKEQEINYRLINKRDAVDEQFIELNQLLIGKEWSESDSSLNINLINRPSDSTVNQNDIKQLNETEDSHSNSQIHDNFVQNSPNFQTSNQEYSGLIGCLHEIQLNGHRLEFSVQPPTVPQSNLADFTSSDYLHRRNLVTGSVWPEQDSQTILSNFTSAKHAFEQIIQIQNQSNTTIRPKSRLDDKLTNRAVRNDFDKVVKDELNKKQIRTEDRRSISGKRSFNASDGRTSAIDENSVKMTSSIERDAMGGWKDSSVQSTKIDKSDYIEHDFKKRPIEDKEHEASAIDWWNNVQLLNNSLVGKIDLGICNQSDPCTNFCLHNASCMLDEDGEPICHCDRVGYTGERCFFRKLPFCS